MRSLFLACGGSLLLAGCSSGTQLDVTLRLPDAVYTASSTARIIIAGSALTSFPVATTPTPVASGLLVTNRDVDGDGFIDIVVETTKDFALEEVSHFSITLDKLAAPVSVDVRAETFDARGNRLARIGGANRVLAGDHVTAVLAPSTQASAPDLQPSCVGACPNATAIYGAADVGQIVDLAGAAPTALSAGAFDTKGRVELAIGAGDATTASTTMRVAQPSAGRVEVWSGTGGSLAKTTTLVGVEAGDRLGATLAVADLDGDGIDDLVVGSPGDTSGRGAVWALYGPLASVTALSGANVARASTTAAGAQLGASLVVDDLDGDGKAEILVGAPGVDALYVLHASDLPRAQADLVLPTMTTSTLTGVAGSRFATSIATREGWVTVGAPLEPAAYYVSAKQFFDGTVHAVDAAGATRWVGSGGGFGRSVQLCDTDGAGTLSWLVGAPLDGEGRILSRPTTSLGAGDANGSGIGSARGSVANGGFGAQITVARAGLGDRILVGAAASTTDPGAAYVFPSATLVLDPEMALDATGSPAGIVVDGANAGNGFGSIVTVGDFNQDGALDLAIGAASAGTVSIVTGPIL